MKKRVFTNETLGVNSSSDEENDGAKRGAYRTKMADAARTKTGEISKKIINDYL